MLEYLHHDQEATVQQQLSHGMPLYTRVCCTCPTVPQGLHCGPVRAAQCRDLHPMMHHVVVSKDFWCVLEYSRHDREVTVLQQLSHRTPLHIEACCGYPTVPQGLHRGPVRAVQHRDLHPTMHHVVV